MSSRSSRHRKVAVDYPAITLELFLLHRGDDLIPPKMIYQGGRWASRGVYSVILPVLFFDMVATLLPRLGPCLALRGPVANKRTMHLFRQIAPQVGFAMCFPVVPVVERVRTP